MTKTISYFLATILCLSGCIATQTAPPTTPPPSHIYMEDLRVDIFPAVGSINFESDGRLIGSGVLISPNIVLTAAHVTENKDDIIYVEHDGDEYCIEEVIYYPTHAPGLLIHDIAIIVLETNSDEVPIELIDPEKDAIFKRMDLTTVGFGTGRKRFSNYGMFWYYGRLIQRPEFMIMLPINASIWFGDSGGAVLTQQGKLIGIMSYFETTGRGKIYENGCASIEYYKDWIEEVKGERLLERMDK